MYSVSRTLSNITSSDVQAAALSIIQGIVATALNPVAPTDLVSKSYVDAFANGISWKEACDLKTVALLPAYTVTGLLGAKTLQASTNGALVLDGITVVLGYRILVDQIGVSLSYDAGIYVCTAAGGVGSAWQLKQQSQDAIIQGTAVQVLGGTISSLEGFVQVSATPVLNTDPQSWVMFSAPPHPVTLYSSGATYNIGDHVTYSDILYRSLASANVAHQPDTSPASWTPVVTGSTAMAATVSPTITLNKGGIAASAGLAGLKFEEGGSSTGSYIRIASTRDKMELKAPTGSNIVLNQSLATTDTPSFANTILSSAARKMFTLNDLGTATDHTQQNYDGLGYDGANVICQVKNTGTNFIFDAATSSIASTMLMTIYGSGGASVPGTLWVNGANQNSMIVLGGIGTVANPATYNILGFGISNDTLRYQVNATSTDHVFFAATSAVANNEVFRIKGIGNAVLPGNLAAGSLTSTGAVTGSNITTMTSDIAADKATLAAATSAATASTVAKRDGTGGCTFAALTTSSVSATGAASCATLKMTTGATAGYQLISDASGNASWSAPTSSMTMAGDVTGTSAASTVVSARNGFAVAGTMSSSGAATLGGLILPTTGGTAATLSYYEDSYAHTMNMIGPKTGYSVSLTLLISRIGNIVTIKLPNTMQASVSANITQAFQPATAGDYIPARFRPSLGIYAMCAITDNTLNQTGFWSGLSTGFFTIGNSAAVAFTASGLAGFFPQVITYQI
jgi:hypothetical protein